MKQMIASWSMVMVHGLMVAGLGRSADLSEIVGSQEGRGASWKRDWSSNVVVFRPVIWTVPELKRLKSKFIL